MSSSSPLRIGRLSDPMPSIRGNIGCDWENGVAYYLVSYQAMMIFLPTKKRKGQRQCKRAGEDLTTGQSEKTEAFFIILF